MNIFFAQSILYEKNFKNQMSISMKKKLGNFTAGMFKKYKNSLEALVN